MCRSCPLGCDRIDHAVTLCSHSYKISLASPPSFTALRGDSIRGLAFWRTCLPPHSVVIKLEVGLLAKCNVALDVGTVLISEAMSVDAAFSRRCGP